MDEKIKEVKIYDPPMCCSTGVCGPNVDSALVELAGALRKISKQGILVERWNLSQQPQAFTENLTVKDLLTNLGAKGLPFIFVNDELKLSGRYPASKELFAWLGINEEEMAEENSAQTKSANMAFPMLKRDEETQSADACRPDGGACS